MLKTIPNLFCVPVILLLLLSCGGTTKVLEVANTASWKQCANIDTTSKVIFSDNFDNNNNKWPLTNNKRFLANVANGVFHVEKFHQNAEYQGCLWLVKAIRGFDTKSNFQISFDAKFLKCKDTYNEIDLQWGHIQEDSYQITFTNDGQIVLRRFTENKSPKWVPIASTVMKNLVNKDHSNKITIRQIDDTCIICINGYEAINTKVEKLGGNFIGIQQCWKVAWELDNIEIRQ